MSIKSGEGHSSTLGTYTTDASGVYKFTLTPADIGKNLQIVPIYNNSSSGEMFSPKHKVFKLAHGENTFHFRCTAEPKLRGRIWNQNGSSVEGVEVSIGREANDGQVSSWKKYTTGPTGNYDFTLACEDLGKVYRIVPKFPSNPMQQFLPEEKVITVTDGVNKNDFLYLLPLSKHLSGVLRMPEGKAIPGVRVNLYYVLNSQYIAIETKYTDSDGFYVFHISPDKAGYEYVIRPEDPNVKPFDPLEYRFIFSGLDSTFNFKYAAPLPDLIPYDQQFPELECSLNSNALNAFYIFVTNQGSVPSGPCHLKYEFQYVPCYMPHGNVECKKQPGNYAQVPSLAPGAYIKVIDEQIYPVINGNCYLILKSYEVDPANEVEESNGINNYKKINP